jgi:uncharacterized protein (DUF362 family)
LAIPSILPKTLMQKSRGSGLFISLRFFPLLFAAVVAGSLSANFLPFDRPFESISIQEQKIMISLMENRLPASTYSDIFAIQGTTGADGGFRSLIELMKAGGLSFYSLIESDDVVLIKVNCQWDERGGTNTDLVKAIIESILNHPDGFAGEIIVADNGQAQFGAKGRGGSLDFENNNALIRSQSNQKVVDSFAPKHQVSTVLWDLITTVEVQEYSEGDYESGYVVSPKASAQTGIVVSYPKFRTTYGTHVSFKHGIWNRNTEEYDSDRFKVINVPVLKSHMIYGVTASVKHYMGVVSDKLTNHKAHRSVGNGGMGTQMVETRVPVLNIVDAIWVNAKPGSGPRTRYSQAAQTNIIAAGADPVALDAWAASRILIPTAEKLGYGSTSQLDPDNTKNGSFGHWLRLSMQELQRGGYEPTMDTSKVNISVSSLQNFELE